MEVSGASNVARELKRPLIELRQLAFGLSLSSFSDEKIRSEMVDVADAAMRQIDNLVRVGELSKFRLEPIAVRAVCDEAADALVKAVNKKTRSAIMVVKYSNRARLAMGNRELLMNIIYNYLLDALNYTMEEEGYDTRVILRVKEVEDKIEIEVRDFGPVLPAMRPKSSTLGLYVTEKFSKYMHAEIGTMRHRDGTSVFVRLPVLRQQKIWGTK